MSVLKWLRLRRAGRVFEGVLAEPKLIIIGVWS